MRAALLRLIGLGVVMVLCGGCQAWLARVSVTPSGGEPILASTITDMSADGRYVVFNSSSDDLTAGDNHQVSDVFRRDVTTGTTLKVSVAADGGNTNLDSFEASVSSDGRYVAFESSASNIVAGDVNGADDVFVRDMATGTTTLASVDPPGFAPPGWQSREYRFPSISADGHHVAFMAVNRWNGIGQPPPPYSEVLLRDLTAGTTQLVSVHSGTQFGTSFSDWPDVSGDGRYVAFSSGASDLVAGDQNDQGDVFVRDVQTQTTTRVSVDANGSDADGPSARAVITPDGRYVAFSSLAADIVPDTAAGGTSQQIYVRDRSTGTTAHVSSAVGGGPSHGDNVVEAITPDGRFIAWSSNATDLVAGDSNGVYDEFVRDRQLGETLRVSLGTTGAQGDGNSWEGRLSADGRFVAFELKDQDFVSGNTTSSRLSFSAAGGPHIIKNVTTPAARRGRARRRLRGGEGASGQRQCGHRRRRRQPVNGNPLLQNRAWP